MVENRLCVFKGLFKQFWVKFMTEEIFGSEGTKKKKKIIRVDLR